MACGAMVAAAARVERIMISPWMHSQAIDPGKTVKVEGICREL